MNRRHTSAVKALQDWTCQKCEKIMHCNKGAFVSHVRWCGFDYAAHFWGSVQKGPGCWLWTASKRWDGYGRYNVQPGKRQLTAHRYSWELANGPIPEGMGVLHKCDTPACVNPDHLFLGSHKENMRDAYAKRRHAHGDRATRRKLSEADVADILRNPPTTGKHGNVKEYAARYRVNPGAIHAILKRRYWKFVAADNGAKP